MYFTDKELVQRAARAAGFLWKTIPVREESGNCALWLLRADGTLFHTGWNPLKNIDQAMDLLFRMKLRLEVDASSELPSECFAKVFWGQEGAYTLTTFGDYNSADAAICRSILRAISNMIDRENA